MTIKTIQNRFTRDFVPEKKPTAIEVEVFSDNKGKPAIKVYFGAGVKCADYYVLGCDDAGCADTCVPVLLPCGQNEGGFKVRRTEIGGGILRFILTDDALSIFGKEVVESVGRQCAWHKEIKRRIEQGESVEDMEPNPEPPCKLDGEIDKNQRVWLNNKEE